MILTKYITKTCVIPELQASAKSDAIKELTHLLFDKKKMKNVEMALDQVIAREATESTGIGNGIAVPHARVPGMKNMACAVARVPDGIDFLAVDRQPVKLIFLICYPPTQQTTYLNFVGTIAGLLSDKEHFDALLEADTDETIFNVLESVSEKFNEKQEDTIKAFQADPEIETLKDGHADIMLLARLQLHEEMLATTTSGKKVIKDRIAGIRAMVEPRILKHYDKLMKGRAPALVRPADKSQGLPR